ncbi:MAG: hypothetical protein QM724_09730 [Flavobacteriales bacterium]
MRRPLLFLFLLAPVWLMAQTATLFGVVRGDDGKPLPDVGILVDRGTRR